MPGVGCLAAGQNLETGQLSRHYIYIAEVMLLSFFQPQSKMVTLAEPECDVIYSFTKWHIHINIGISVFYLVCVDTGKLNRKTKMATLTCDLLIYFYHPLRIRRGIHCTALHMLVGRYVCRYLLTLLKWKNSLTTKLQTWYVDISWWVDDPY